MSETPKEEKPTGEETAASEATETVKREEALTQPSTPENNEVSAATKDEKPAPAADKPVRKPLTPEEREARLKAAAEAKAARAQAAESGGAEATPTGDAPAKERPARAPRAAKTEAPAVPKEPSPKQPLLEKLVADLQAAVASDAIEGAYINEPNNHLPTITVKSEHWLAVAKWLKDEPEWACNYLRNLSGVDLETEMEVVYHLIGLSTMQEVAVHVKTNREQPSIDSVTPLWPTANWNEREVYDLFGIEFPGHPDLRRIMMPDDWVGYPLRKDYQSLDSEV